MPLHVSLVDTAHTPSSVVNNVSAIAVQAEGTLGQLFRENNGVLPTFSKFEYNKRGTAVPGCSKSFRVFS